MFKILKNKKDNTYWIMKILKIAPYMSKSELYDLSKTYGIRWLRKEYKKRKKLFESRGY